MSQSNQKENDRIYLSPPHMGGNELTYIHEAFDTNWVAPVGPNLENFEKEIAQYTGVPHVAALTSGTAAIHLALIMLGVGKGDEVICSSFTFAASCNPIVYQGAVPVFIDSEADTWNMDPELLQEAIEDRIKKGKKPKAIILVHLYGMPAKMDELIAVANEYEIPIIEDAAEALGSSYKGKKTGGFGDMAVFSFNGNKIITTSGGGALVAKNKTYIDKARFLATQARDDAPHYEHTHIGYNYRLSNISAGIGRGQLEVLDKHIALRRENYDWYKRVFRGVEGVAFVDEPQEAFCNRWLTTVLIHPEKTNGVDREAIRQLFEEENIESRPLWKPMHLQPVFKDAPAYKNGLSEYFFERGLCLPSGSSMTDLDKKRIFQTLQKVLRLVTE